MNKRVTLKRILVLLLTFTMTLGCLNIAGLASTSGVVKAKEQATATDSQVSATTAGENEGESFEYENTYNSENFDVNFKLDSVWDAGYNATITISNTSDSVIENWYLTFPLNETISNIWNASISETHEDFYVIKNAGWNQDIAVGESVSFGITVYEPFTEYPEYYTILGNEIETRSEDYTVDYKITEDWGEGYKAEVTITNNKDVAIEDWRLVFEYGDNLITQIWNAVIVANIEGKYELSCESYNQNIASGASVTFGFMVEPGCSGKLIENVALKEYVATEGADENDENKDDENGEGGETDDNQQDILDTENIAIIYGSVDEETDTLILEAMASIECENCEIYASKDGGDYQLIGNTDEYGYIESPLTGDFTSMEVYALCYGVDGQKIESNHIFVENQNGLYSAIMPDTDQDGIEDYYELYYGCDTSLVDTDEDGLSDYYEIAVCLLDPTKMDSDEDGVQDGDEDIDIDGLTTLEELELETDPVYEDTDNDNVKDGDEVNIYFINPLLEDTDGDTLIDGDEIGLGLNPNLTDTDGDGILDCDEIFKQTYEYQVENEECVVEAISVQVSGAGYLQGNTSIKSVMEEDTFCANVVGLVGEPFEITTTCEFEEATITFKIDKTKLGDTIFEDLMFLWYDEENYEFVELDTNHNSHLGWVSVKTNHFSKYMIVDQKEWYDAWAEEKNYGIRGHENYDEYYTMFLIESNRSISEIDPISVRKYYTNGDYYYEEECYRRGFVENYVNSMSDNEKVSIYTFNYGLTSRSQFSQDKEYLKTQLIPIDDYDGGVVSISSTLLGAAWSFPDDIVGDENICKRIIMLAQPHYYENLYSAEKELLRNNIQLDVILLGGDSKYDEFVELVEKTGGHVYILEDFDELSQLYYNIFYNKEFDTTDSDGDMLYDVVEKEGIRLKNGQVIYTRPYDEDTDGDNLLDGEEIIPELVYSPTKYSISKSIYRSYYNWNSDPTNIDTDGDGIQDDVDNRPFDLGFYSDEAGKIVVGKLTIVASEYNRLGHSYLLYESYVKDSLGLYFLTGGYSISDHNGKFSYERIKSGTVYLNRGECVTIGNSSVSAGFGSGAILETEEDEGFVDDGGIYYNREVAVEINEYKKNKQEVYVSNVAYSNEISEEELSKMISYHQGRNYYNIVTNNCNEVAIGAWNYTFDVDEFDMTPFPKGLKKQIQSKNNWHSISLQRIWGIR